MFFSSSPSVCATSLRPGSGILGRRPDLHLVAAGHARCSSCGSSVRVREERIAYAASTTLRRASERADGVAVRAQGLRRALSRRARRPGARSPRCSARAVGPSSHFTSSCWRALSACHQLSATMATPGSSPVNCIAPSAMKVGPRRPRRRRHGARRAVLDRVEIGADHLAAEHRAFLEDRIEHARHHGSMPNSGLPVTHPRAVDAAASNGR